MPYITEHRELLQTNFPSKSVSWLDKKHKDEFVNWLRCHLLGKKLGTQLDALAKGPSSTILKYQGYEINGFTFYKKKQDAKSTYQNSGVRFDAHDENGNVEMTYYGFIEEIWELDYGPLKPALFHCQWVRVDEINIDREGFCTVDLNKTAYKDDPFVLAKDVIQIFYASDNVTKGARQVVLEGKRKIVGVDGVTDDEDYRGYQEMPPFAANADLPIIQEGDEPAYVRLDHHETIIVDATKAS